MTIICVDRNTIACDGQRSTGQRISGIDVVKFKFASVDGSPRIYAITGLLSAWSAAIRWVEDGAKLDDLPRTPGDSSEGYWGLAVIKEAGIWRYASDNPWGDFFEPPYAMGSGCDFAFGAMWAGATARQAVEIAAKNLTCCGGKITEMRLPWAEKQLARRAATPWPGEGDPWI